MRVFRKLHLGKELMVVNITMMKENLNGMLKVVLAKKMIRMRIVNLKMEIKKKNKKKIIRKMFGVNKMMKKM
jgi:hypothetical protein